MVCGAVPKPPAVPPNDSLGLDDDEGITPAGPDPGEHHPEAAVQGGEARSAPRSPQDLDLMSEREIFEDQGLTDLNSDAAARSRVMMAIASGCRIP